MAEGENKPVQANEKVEPMAPGSVVQPGSQPPVAPLVTVTPPQTPQAEPLPPSPPQPTQSPAPSPPKPEPISQPAEAENLDEGFYSDYDGRQGPPDLEAVTWTASEFVAHDKSTGWYLTLALVVVLVSALDYLLTKDLFSVGVVIFASIVFAIYASHKPNQKSYSLDDEGITVDKRRFSYSEFRTFSVVPEDAFASIVFMPLKRFAPPLTVYYDPADEDKILGLLTQYLPFEHKRPDAVESLMRRIRF